MNEAETVRALLRAGLDEEATRTTLTDERFEQEVEAARQEAEEEEEEEEAEEVVADGGAVTRPLLRTMAAVACTIGLLAIAGSFLSAEAGAGAIGLEFLSMALAAFLTTAGTFLPLLTTVPERADEMLWAASRRVRRRVAA